jgi:glucokinase
VKSKQQKMMKLAVGIDIGGTNTRFGLVDRTGKIVLREALLTTDFSDPKELVNAIKKKIAELMPADSELIGVGIGAPNGNYFHGTIENAPNLEWKGIVHLADYFKERMQLPAILTNDANAAALGEMIFGGAKKMKDFIFITLGTGLGSGIVVNGQMVYGHDGFAGELGHTIIIQHGRQCGCGRKGCLEQYCSATGIVKTYFEILKSNYPDALHHLDVARIDAKYIFDRAMNGDEDAFYAFNYTGELLGFALANSVTYTSPEAIFLFGGLAQAGELLFNPVILSFEKNILNNYKGKVKILPSLLPESDAALLGAASLIWKEVRN